MTHRVLPGEPDAIAAIPVPSDGLLCLHLAPKNLVADERQASTTFGARRGTTAVRAAPGRTCHLPLTQLHAS